MAYHLASRIALAVTCQLLTLIASTHEQAELHTTQDDPSGACTRAPEGNESTAAPGAHLLCFSFEPLSTTTAKAASPLPFSLSAQQTPPVLWSSTTTTTRIPQAFNSTSNHGVSKSTVYTTLRGIGQATSTFTPEGVHNMANGTSSPNGVAFATMSQTSTTDSNHPLPTTALPEDSDGTANATMFPVVLHTVTFTTTICPSGR
ncbi:hypothetical protein MBLNU13_g00393t1 [Cladosporium sp. NU13]